MVRQKFLPLMIGLLIFCVILPKFLAEGNYRKYTSEDLKRLKDEVREMFSHAYESYLTYAYPYDELRPLSCDGIDTWGSYSLTLIDALDTLAIIGNKTEFQRVYKLISEKTDFDANINVSVFETNIRIVGGLLSAHLLAKHAGAELEPGWPCDGPLLRLAEDVATRLLPAFDTKTGMPYGTVNLRHGVPDGETPVTCTAGVGTFVVEFGALSRLTGNSVFEDTAMRAMQALWHHRSTIGLVGNHIDVESGKWTATDSGVGAGVDSYFEYLVKGAILLQRPELMTMFKKSRDSIEQYMNHDDWHFWVSMKQGQVTMPVFQSLEAFWPGMLSLIGDNMSAMKSLHNYHQVWKQFGFLPEFYNVAQSAAAAKREGYPLRPEFIESVMYLYRGTKDPFLLNVGEDVLRSIQHSARTRCGYATVKDVRDHTLEDRMESFFLAETTKYLYLLFDTDNFIHNTGTRATLIETSHGKCVIDAGGYIFNTEAHPIDPATLQCCSGHTEQSIKEHMRSHMLDMFDPTKFNEFQGDLIPTRIKEIEEAREKEEQEKRIRETVYQMRMEEQRAKEREHIRKQREREQLRKKMQDKAMKLEDVAALEQRETEGNTGVGTVEEVKQTIELNSSNEREYDNETAHKAKIDSDLVPQVSDIDDLDVKVIEENDTDELLPVRGEDSEMPMDSTNMSVDLEAPEFTSDTVNDKPVDEEPQEQVLIKRQSKDETTEPLKIIKKTEINFDPSELLDTISNMIHQIIPPQKGRRDFTLSDFRRRLSTDTQYSLNSTWRTNYALMTCPAQSFFEKFSIQGEFFEVYK